MSPSFVSCPIEVVHEMIKLLELADIRNLRLSCKLLAAKSSSSHHVKTFFQAKHVELTEQAFRNLAEGTQARGLRCLVQELTLSGIAVGDAPRRTYTERRQSSRRSNIRLLSQSFNGLAKNGPTGKLALLSLGVAVHPGLTAKREFGNSRMGFNLEPVWRAAVDTFHTTFRALAASQLRIESLNIFNCPGQQRCGFACNELSKIDWDDQGLAESLQSVRSLSVSTSNRVSRSNEDEDKDEYGDDATNDRPRSRRSNHDEDIAIAQDESNFTGLASLFQLLKQLESFEMHYFLLPGALRRLRPIDWCHERLLEHIIKLDSLPNLARCKLRGIYATETDLLAFIQRTGVGELSLENVVLTSGTFRSIFDYCTSAENPITMLYFDVLREINAPSPMVLFLGPGRSKLGYHAVGLGSEMLERCVDDVKQPISYHTPPLPPMGSPAMAAWMAFQRREYGRAQ
ncbi:hypothetical protein BJ170DRAFT_174211 [Xylariales sp. AK1849]|nr:hypothetical protein BJ170DRAFT_174211 [Xylariales sp. AK1849]